DPVVEPGGGAAGAAGHWAGRPARGVGWLGVAACGVVLRPVLAAVRLAGRKPVLAVVAARGALACAAAGIAGCVLAAAAARGAGQVAGGAAVAAAAVAGPRAAAPRRGR